MIKGNLAHISENIVAKLPCLVAYFCLINYSQKILNNENKF